MAGQMHCTYLRALTHIKDQTMWNRRNEPESNHPPEPQPRAYAPAPPSPSATLDPPARASIGPSVSIKGEIRAKEELYIDGDVEGLVESQHKITVGPSGKVRANIQAREVVIQGQVHGNVHAAERLTIRKSATLVGDIRTAGIVIEDGAYFKGSIDILRSETGKAKESQSQSAAAAASASAGPAVTAPAAPGPRIVETVA
jgi:cytoskeletal protein CcmA (bactofilin family)